MFAVLLNFHSIHAINEQQQYLDNTAPSFATSYQNSSNQPQALVSIVAPETTNHSSISNPEHTGSANPPAEQNNNVLLAENVQADNAKSNGIQVTCTLGSNNNMVAQDIIAQNGGHTIGIAVLNNNVQNMQATARNITSANGGVATGIVFG